MLILHTLACKTFFKRLDNFSDEPVGRLKSLMFLSNVVVSIGFFESSLSSSSISASGIAAINLIAFSKSPTSSSKRDKFFDNSYMDAKQQHS